MSDVLQHILNSIDEAHTKGILPICVFDLDGTLFLTRSRTLAILADFAKRTGRDALAQVVAGISIEEQRYLVLEPLAQRMELSAEEKAAILAWWRGHFFTDEWCAGDKPMAGGPAFVRACFERGAFIYYLTGRHIHGMERGTAQSIVSNDMPLYGGRALLQLKPDFTTDDEVYKLDALSAIRSLNGQVIATFENEPGNANLFAEAFPEATHVLVGNTHRPDAPPPRDDIVRVRDFTRAP